MADGQEPSTWRRQPNAISVLSFSPLFLHPIFFFFFFSAPDQF
jgi:hypothetical protein